MKPDTRMRLESLAMVNRIADERQALLHRIAVIEGGDEDRLFGAQPKFCVTVDGYRFGADVKALLRPVLIRELRARVASLDKDLQALGVDPQ